MPKVDVELSFRKGVFLRRYKRFFADVECEVTNQVLTLHCPNTGAMTGLLQEGCPALFTLATPKELEKRKTPGTLELLQIYDQVDSCHYWVGVNTLRANQIARRWLEFSTVQEYFAITSILQEIKIQTLLQKSKSNLNNKSLDDLKTRVDFCIERQNQKPLLIEVKSATLYESPQGFFPDAVSARATKQLNDLMVMQALGWDVLILYVSQHQGISEVNAAKSIDPDYATTVLRAQQQGVQFKTLKFDSNFFGLAAELSTPQIH